MVLKRGADGWRVADLGSSTGTKLNGTFIESSALNTGDVLTIGPYKITVTIRTEAEYAAHKQANTLKHHEALFNAIVKELREGIETLHKLSPDDEGRDSMLHTLKMGDTLFQMGDDQRRRDEIRDSIKLLRAVRQDVINAKTLESDLATNVVRAFMGSKYNWIWEDPIDQVMEKVADVIEQVVASHGSMTYLSDLDKKTMSARGVTGLGRVRTHLIKRAGERGLVVTLALERIGGGSRESWQEFAEQKSGQTFADMEAKIRKAMTPEQLAELGLS